METHYLGHSEEDKKEEDERKNKWPQNEKHDGNKSTMKQNKRKKRGASKISLLQIILNRSDTSCPLNVAKYGPAIIEHCLLNASVDGRMPITQEWEGLNLEDTKKIIDEFYSIPSLLQTVKQEPPLKQVNLSPSSSDSKKEKNDKGNKNNTIMPAYITYHTLKSTDNAMNIGESVGMIGNNEAGTNIEIYDEFLPVLLKQHTKKKYKVFPSFVSAVDEFYSKSEAQKAAKRHNIIEAAAKSKLIKMKREQEDRIESLKIQEISSIEKAQAIEANCDNIDKARLVVNSAIANGIDWDELKELVDFEKSRNNPIASLIVQLKLDSNTIVLCLPGWDDDGNVKMIRVDIDVSMTAYQNARKYYQTKKQLNKKVMKTKEAAEAFLSNAEENIQKEMTRAKNKLESTIIRQARKVYWFEKFDWFISSENFLVVLGRDMQQNEQLVKRYMRKGDVYVHADVHGASSCIVRNNDLKKDIPPLTLNEAGHMCMCRSSAWKSRTVTSAWWVYHNQVSKTAPSGEYLTTGSFMIRGKKNFLRPSRLEVGFGLLFCVAEEDIKHHLNERIVRGSVDGIENDANIDVRGKKNKTDGDTNEEDHAEKLRRFERKLLRKQQEEQNAIEMAAENAYNESVGIESTHESNNTSSDIKDIQLDVGDDLDGVETNDMDYEANTTSNIVNEILNHKPGISRYQRKVLRGQRKEKKTVNVADDDEGDDDGDHLLDSLKEKKSNITTTKKKEKVKSIPRGKKGKLKKIKKKYKDQDDEERRIRMKALGNPMPEPICIEAEARNTERDEKSNTNLRTGKQNKNSRSNRGHSSNLKQSQQGKVDDNIPLELPDVQLRALTALPRSEDTILFCLPVSGPYSTMNKYKYKVKLTPGSQKRGRSCKAVLQHFLQNVKEGTTKREKELIRTISDAEAIAAMLSDVQINTSAAAKMSKKISKGKKQGSKKNRKNNSGKKKKR